MKMNRSRAALSVLLLAFISGGAGTLVGASTAQSAQDEQPVKSSAQPAPAQTSAQAAAASGGEAPSADDSADDSACLSDPAVLKELSNRKQALDQRERDLAAREAELKAREAAVSDEMKGLQNLRDQISGMQAAKKKESAEKVAKIVSTLEGMSPNAAAQMLTDLDDGLAVSAISQMSTTKLSKVMNKLDPKRAAQLSELLAGVARARNANASNGAAVATNMKKGGESNDQQPESIISGGPEQFGGSGNPSNQGKGAAGGQK